MVKGKRHEGANEQKVDGGIKGWKEGRKDGEELS